MKLNPQPPVLNKDRVRMCPNSRLKEPVRPFSKTQTGEKTFMDYYFSKLNQDSPGGIR